MAFPALFALSSFDSVGMGLGSDVAGVLFTGEGAIGTGAGVVVTVSVVVVDAGVDVDSVVVAVVVSSTFVVVIASVAVVAATVVVAAIVVVAALIISLIPFSGSPKLVQVASKAPAQTCTFIPQSKQYLFPRVANGCFSPEECSSSVYS